MNNQEKQITNVKKKKSGENSLFSTIKIKLYYGDNQGTKTF